MIRVITSLKILAASVPVAQIWYKLKNIVVDSNAQTLTAGIEHFSSHATFDRIQLRPEKANLKVGKSVSSACRPTKATRRGIGMMFKYRFPRAISFMENELKDYWAKKTGINEYEVIIRPLDDN